MKTLKNLIMVSCFIIAAGIRTQAQTESDDRSLLEQMHRDDKTAIDAVAMYPEDVRRDIFVACMNPEIIVRLSAMQKKTNADFTSLLSPYSKDEQDKIWNLTRYPGLISKLAEDHKKNAAEINKILESYPPEIHKTALEEGTKNYDLMEKIDQSNKSYNENFDQMMNGYPAFTANAFKELIKQPEVLDILANNMHMTVIVGDVYKKNPELVTHQLDSLNTVLSQKSKQETAEWQQSLETNPDAKKEYEQAAKEYAQENGYNEQSYSTPVVVIQSDYYAYPYNWWFGYPSWYSYPYWRPYPYWYDWGFYYGPGFRMTYYGMPSGRFFNWYWNRPLNHYRYSRFSNHCYNYYNGHPHAYGYNPVCRGVRDWRLNNRGIVTKGWDVDNGHRAEMFKEYGKMEMERTDYNTQNPQRALNKQEYLKMNESKYPTINADVAQHANDQNTSRPQLGTQTPNIIPRSGENKPAEGRIENQPANNAQPQYNKPQQEVQHYNVQPQNNAVQPQYNNPQQPQHNAVQPQNNNPQYSNPRTNLQNMNQNPAGNIRENNNARPNYNYPQQLHNAEENHRSTWQQIQSPQSAPSRPSYQPAPSRQNYQPAPSRPSFQSAPSAPSRPSFQSAPARQSAPSGGSRSSGAIRR